jgi:hypothetical protein
MTCGTEDRIENALCLSVTVRLMPVWSQAQRKQIRADQMA